MRTGLFPTLLFMAALANPPDVRAQDTPADTADIHTALRAFYFSLSHRDWEAIAGQVLSAKVVAHRPPPDAMVAAEAAAGRAAGLACGESRVTLDGTWAEVSVVRCGGAARGVGASVAPKIVIKLNGKEAQREEYRDVRADRPLPPDLYVTQTYHRADWIPGH